MRGHSRSSAPASAADGRPRLTDEEFRTLMREARTLARRRILGRPPPGESDFAHRTQHAEFGGAAH